MLTILTDPAKLKFSPLMSVYSEDICLQAEAEYAHLPKNEALFLAEQDFYAYMTRAFLPTKGAFLAIWGDYRSALRMEPYMDGLLLTGLTTDPAHRRKGYATQLLKAVLRNMPDAVSVYSHVEKNNIPSVTFHEKFGFQKLHSYGKMLNGELLHNFWTFSYRKNP